MMTTGHGQAQLGGLTAKLGNHGSAVLSWSHTHHTGLSSSKKLAPILETDLGDLRGISELWGKEAMPRGNPQAPLDGRHPACGLRLLWYPEPACPFEAGLQTAG